MVENSRVKGSFGENLASDFLKSKGYKIVNRNYRWRGGEIDLIAEGPNSELIFLEVKTDYSWVAGNPEEWVNRKKINRIRKTAEYYCWKHNVKEREIRFDVIGIRINGPDYEIDHIPQAFTD